MLRMHAPQGAVTSRMACCRLKGGGLRGTSLKGSGLRGPSPKGYSLKGCVRLCVLCAARMRGRAFAHWSSHVRCRQIPTLLYLLFEGAGDLLTIIIKMNFNQSRSKHHEEPRLRGRNLEVDLGMVVGRSNENEARGGSMLTLLYLVSRCCLVKSPRPVL